MSTVYSTPAGSSTVLLPPPGALPRTSEEAQALCAHALSSWLDEFGPLLAERRDLRNRAERMNVLRQVRAAHEAHLWAFAPGQPAFSTRFVRGQFLDEAVVVHRSRTDAVTGEAVTYGPRPHDPKLDTCDDTAQHLMPLLRRMEEAGAGGVTLRCKHHWVRRLLAGFELCIFRPRVEEAAGMPAWAHTGDVPLASVRLRPGASRCYIRVEPGRCEEWRALCADAGVTGAAAGVAAAPV